MKKELNALVNVLKKAGYKEHADKVASIKIKVDPLTFAVSQGLLNPSVLSVLHEEGNEEDLSEFKELLEEIQMDTENPESNQTGKSENADSEIL